MFDDERTLMGVRLDVLISQLARTVDDHETRLRATEGGQNRTDSTLIEFGKDLADHEQRLRAADCWRYALPVSVLCVVLASAGSALAALAG